jgi:hypothetical protein
MMILQTNFVKFWGITVDNTLLGNNTLIQLLLN